MDAKGFVVPPGGGSVLSMAPGRSAALKLLGGETGDSIMLFEETAPAGTETTFHLHRDSDEVAYVLSGEITFNPDCPAIKVQKRHRLLTAAVPIPSQRTPPFCKALLALTGLVPRRPE
jgi:hypothetical protein